MASIRQAGGLKAHMEQLGYDYPLFIRMAEANWSAERGIYIGQRTMARVLGLTDTTIIKYLRIYDEEIGRTRHGKNKHADSL